MQWSDLEIKGRKSWIMVCLNGRGVREEPSTQDTLFSTHRKVKSFEIVNKKQISKNVQNFCKKWIQNMKMFFIF